MRFLLTTNGGGPRRMRRCSPRWASLGSFPEVRFGCRPRAGPRVRDRSWVIGTCQARELCAHNGHRLLFQERHRPAPAASAGGYLPGSFGPGDHAL